MKLPKTSGSTVPTTRSVSISIRAGRARSCAIAPIDSSATRANLWADIFGTDLLSGAALDSRDRACALQLCIHGLLLPRFRFLLQPLERIHGRAGFIHLMHLAIP